MVLYLDDLILTNNNVPAKAFNIFGCPNCEWKNSTNCPFHTGFDDSKADILPESGICQERVNWLSNMTRPYAVKPSFNQWFTDLHKIMGDVQLRQEYEKIRKLENNLETVSLTHPIGTKEYHQAEKALTRVKDRWQGLWKELVKFEDTQVAREMPKKLEVTHTHLSLEQLHNIMRGSDAKVVDAEVLDDDS